MSGMSGRKQPMNHPVNGSSSERKRASKATSKSGLIRLGTFEAALLGRSAKEYKRRLVALFKKRGWTPLEARQAADDFLAVIEEETAKGETTSRT